MEENKNYNDERDYHHHHYDDCWLCKHPLLKHIITALMVFLGAYLAFYTVADWHFKRMMDPAVQIRSMERNMLHEQRQIENMYKRDFERGVRLEQRVHNFIHIEKENNAYQVIVNLRPFDNDEKNVEISTDGDTLTITAAGETSSKRGDKMIKVMQQYSFDEDVDFNRIKKDRKGDDYIITIPFKK